MARNLLYIMRRPFSLALAWILGLLSGMSVFVASDRFLISWMRLVPLGRVSIVHLIAVTFFPFLISALAASFSWSILLLPVCFCRAALLSFVSCGLIACFFPGSWLVCGLLLCRSWVAVPFLYRFWYRHLSGSRLSASEIWKLVGLCFFLGSVDYWIISPLLRRLIVW